jgi:hypothetical protein
MPRIIKCILYLLSRTISLTNQPGKPLEIAPIVG